MAPQSDLEQPQHQERTPADELASAMTTRSAVPGSDLVAVDPDPRALAHVRVALVVEAAVLVVLGLWGLLADLTQHGNGPSGAPVLLFHITWQHAIVLLATAVLALIGTCGHSWALRAMTLQAVGYGVLFIVGVGQVNWFADPADDWLHAGLALVGLGLLMGTASRALGGPYWVHRADLKD